MFKKMAAGLALVIALVLGYAAMHSPDYRISREITINAPADRIFPYLNGSKIAEQWGPWRDEDPEARMTYSGPEFGVGSRSDWTGGKKLGTGSATITESIPNVRVHVRLEYTEPAPMVQDSDYLIRSEGGQSVVTWQVQGKNTFVGRVMCLFFNMDRLVGGMFEKGLGKLKSVVEAK